MYSEILLFNKVMIFESCLGLTELDCAVCPKKYVIVRGRLINKEEVGRKELAL